MSSVRAGVRPGVSPGLCGSYLIPRGKRGRQQVRRERGCQRERHDEEGSAQKRADGRERGHIAL